MSVLHDVFGIERRREMGVPEGFRFGSLCFETVSKFRMVLMAVGCEDAGYLIELICGTSMWIREYDGLVLNRSAFGNEHTSFVLELLSRWWIC